MAAPLVNCQGLVHIYKTSEVEVVALQGLDMVLMETETIAIVGRSGSGKSTLMNILAGIEPPTAGAAVVAGFDLNRMPDRDRLRYRSKVVGYCWQRALRNLSPDLNCRENIEMTLLVGGLTAREAGRRSREMLERFGILHVAKELPIGIDSEEAQRVSLAVSLANGPRLLLADEPTSELDSRTANRLLLDLTSLIREERICAIIVTHDPKVERHVGRVVHIRDGRISTEIRWREGQDTDATEMVVLDRAGRLQIPRDYLQHLGIRDRVKVVLEPDHIKIMPPPA